MKEKKYMALMSSVIPAITIAGVGCTFCAIPVQAIFGELGLAVWITTILIISSLFGIWSYNSFMKS